MLGQRDEAIVKYRQALEDVPSINMRHDQWGIVLTEGWVERRIEKPFIEAMVFTPNEFAELKRRFDGLPWTDAGEEMLEVYKDTISLDKIGEIENGYGWFRLGIKLVGSGYFRQAMDSFKRAEGLLRDQGGSNYFAVIVWQGHIYDVFGKRDKAIAKDRQALTTENSGYMRHDQWKMILTKEWVQLRIEEPFAKEMIGQ